MILWLASYPKSGNTWIRLLITHYFSENKDLFENINKIDSFPNKKQFNQDLAKLLKEFDTVWVAFETQYLEAKLAIDKSVLEQVSSLVETEIKPTDAEDKVDIPAKQQYENDLVDLHN